MTFSRRNFLKLAALGASSPLWPKGFAGLELQSGEDLIDIWKEKYPAGTRLGRALATLPMRARPDADSAEVGRKYEDNLVEILREVVGRGPSYSPHNHRWFETPEGYLWAPYVFPMDFQIQTPLSEIPGGKAWVEVTVPWVQGRIAPRDNAPLLMLQPGDRPTTLYHSSIFPATKTATDDKGQVWYFLDELGAPMYARAEGLRVISAEEVAPISPNVDDKLIVVTLNRNVQYLCAYENGQEVYYAVISSGGKKIDSDVWTTPLGEHPIWRKRIGMRMGGGDSESGFDLVGVGWTCLFSGHGEAIHSTHWHNDFGIPKSHGCVNAKPADAKWIFRWTAPAVAYPHGDKEVSMPGGTRVKVVG
ncbi:MAG: L,D-transpeptidase [Anaerolineales bacterium]|nr:L,D-transpeptidase [Anaerolineales bacterium]